VRDTPPPHNWRKDFLVEIYRAPGQPGFPGKALRTRHELYVEYADGFRELYDLRTDPYQLDNVFSSADAGHVKNLSKRLAELLTPSAENSRGQKGHARPRDLSEGLFQGGEGQRDESEDESSRYAAAWADSPFAGSDEDDDEGADGRGGASEVLN
jgi:hypothetical protein